VQDQFNTEKKDRLNLAVQGWPNQSLPIKKIVQEKLCILSGLIQGNGRAG